MERVEIREVNIPREMGLEVSVEPYLSALSAQYAERGLVRAVRESVEAQIARERETYALAPDAYRLSELTDAAIAGRYRHGKDVMNASDLLSYFAETREKRIQNADFSQNTGMDVLEDAAETDERAVTVSESTALVSTMKEQIKALPSVIKQKLPLWFNGEKPDVSGEKKRFPLSAFASIAAIAASLMLIVTSSIMVTRSEDELSLLKREVDILASEVAEMRSDMNVDTDLLEIRRIATEEYGMVEAEYVKSDYILRAPEEKVEAFEEERSDRLSIDALLSAIGIKK